MYQILRGSCQALHSIWITHERPPIERQALHILMAKERLYMTQILSRIADVGRLGRRLDKLIAAALAP